MGVFLRPLEEGGARGWLQTLGSAIFARVCCAELDVRLLVHDRSGPESVSRSVQNWSG